MPSEYFRRQFEERKQRLIEEASLRIADLAAYRARRQEEKQEPKEK